MVKFLKRRLRDWILDDKDEIKLAAQRDVDSMSDNDPVLHFRVFSAIGGKVVEFRHYDRQRDRHNTQTYIITNEQDFGERIAKIATMEVLKS